MSVSVTRRNISERTLNRQAASYVDRVSALLPFCGISYEQTRLAEIAAHFPGLAKPMRSIIRRLADLLPVVRSASIILGLHQVD
jgi:hypothetical protein